MVQISPCKGPPWMWSKLPGCTVSSLRASSRPAWQWRSCIVLQSWPTRSLVAKFPQHSVVTCSTQILCSAGKERCERGHGWVCTNLWCLMSWHPKRNSSYVSSADLPSDSIHKNLAWWAVTRRTSTKPQNCQNWGVGACLGQYGRYIVDPSSSHWVFSLCGAPYTSVCILSLTHCY